MAVCRKPFINISSEICPCGQCPECLVNRKQIWTHRNILEGYLHKKKSFITLTYDDSTLPTNANGVPNIEKDHLKNFVKNLRSRLGNSIRYYAVGEYGTSGGRGINPHFHLCLYGADEQDQNAINDSWRVPQGRGKKGIPAGFTYVGSLQPESIAYVAGYVQKKTKYNKDMYEELEITPEYSVMSNRPAIALDTLPKIANLLKSDPDYLTEHGDVPYALYHGTRSLPLGTYLREKLREYCNLPHDTETWMDELTGELHEKKIWHGKEEAKAQRKKEMQILQENKLIPNSKLPEDAQVSVKQFYEYQNAQSKKQFDVRQKFIHNSHTL